MNNTPTTLTELRIGRNINGVPMSDARWESFVGHCRAILDGLAVGEQNLTVRRLTQWIEVHRGIGTWTDDNGIEQSEESAVVTLYSDGEHGDEATIDLLMDLASQLAADFEQDAVAVVVGGVSYLARAKQEVN